MMLTFSGNEYAASDIELEVENLKVTLTLVSNVDDLLDRLLTKGEAHDDVRDERIPYWADLWPSAIALSRFLVQSKHIRPGLSVLEIGCGLALPGIVAGKLGAQVTLSDYLPEALEFARHNWRRNLDTPARAQLMDWRHPDPRLAADVVLASDVAYEKRAFPHLPHAFRALCKPGGMVIVSEPGRDVARPFFEALPSRGFFVEKHSVEGQFRTLRYSVQVYVLTSGIRL